MRRRSPRPVRAAAPASTVSPGFDLAAGEFPVAGVDLALGPAGEQEGAVGAHQHADRDLDFLAVRPAFTRPVAVGDEQLAHAACRPAQSRANW
jgi:hypothetical protein